VERHHGSSEEARSQGSRKEGRGDARQKQSGAQRSGAQGRPYPGKKEVRAQRLGSQGRSQAQVALLPIERKSRRSRRLFCVGDHLE
jgi:hypothetical protein